MQTSNIAKYNKSGKCLAEENADDRTLVIFKYIKGG